MRTDRVLIIDDSMIIRAMVEELLASKGSYHAIAMAPDVETARARLRDFHPNVITLDLNMPGVDGLALLEELRDRPHAPIIVLSSSTKKGSDASAQAMALGAYACFDKSKIVSDADRFVRLLAKASEGGSLRAAAPSQPVKSAA